MKPAPDGVMLGFKRYESERTISDSAQARKIHEI